MSSPLRFEGAALRFGSRTIWSGIDLAVRSGEFVAVLGPNGSGKTTLLKAVLGIQPLSAGRLELFGRAPRRGDRRIGYVPQQRLLDSSTPVRGRDIVGFGVDGRRFGLPLRRRADRDRVDGLIESVGGGDFASRPAWQLSGGEQQRLRVGQAIADDPRLLLCDEPLISLDPGNQRVVAELIDRHRRERGAAVLFVTHDVNPVLPMVDRVVYLVDGRVLVGTPDEVLTGATLSRLYRSPVEVLRASGRVVVVSGADDDHLHPDVA